MTTTAANLTAHHLGPEQRAKAWEQLGSQHFDVIVIGGGIVGTGAALDAATRGLSVALIEARDWASGTSSRSSKMFHGGLRYLEQLEFGLVREALHERELVMTKIAPHLVKPQAFIAPLAHRVWERPYMAAGFFLYDTMGGAKTVPRQRHYTKAGTLRLAPSLKPEGLAGAIRYYDTVMDDARYALTVARTAAHFGAVVRTSTQVVGFLQDGGRVRGVRVRDSESGETTEVRGSVVVNCSGVWTTELHKAADIRGRFQVRASKGVHIVVPRDKIISDVALILRTPTSVLYAIPWRERWLIGTTDTDWKLDLAHPAATRSDIEYILGQVNRALKVPLTPADIDGVYAGLRPLLAGEDEATSKLSREHAVAVDAPGLVSIAGGKYTTYRVMAKDAIDAAVPFLPTGAPESVTEDVPLLGADGYPALKNKARSIGQDWDVPHDRVVDLLDRYGSMLPELLALAEEDPGLLRPLRDASDYLRLEIKYACAAEGALHLEDLLSRRTRISIEYPHRGVACAREVAEIAAGVLGWDEQRTKSEIELYTARVDAELRSQSLVEDASADALRAKAPESRGEILEPVPAGGLSD
ncbi:MAG: glycerol-3-phosphate dehydrogenase/oxidase [Segniliparus sp.]|uniref:glycerol-3-phosphate dehydrogenase/oxidase n=1 Tax=Segniliparus sp. TaxID=2804064 RepID=UPI003F3B9BE2